MALWRGYLGSHFPLPALSVPGQSTWRGGVRGGGEAEAEEGDVWIGVVSACVKSKIVAGTLCPIEPSRLGPRFWRGEILWAYENVLKVRLI